MIYSTVLSIVKSGAICLYELQLKMIRSLRRDTTLAFNIESLDFTLLDNDPDISFWSNGVTVEN